MSSPSATPRPALFISYASEDRVAARQIRDALEAAGLDVWYDENELGGGDAWDQKIRRQIRECVYFMPIVSATTERRKEGYFRREWRLAVERSLDMADDVTFLLPVVIDGTSETTSRVPEKFFTVQWLRLPGGTPTPALTALAQRLTQGEAPPPVAPTPTSAAPFPRRAAASAPGDGPPPMPAFPHFDEKGNLGQTFKFFAEVIWWIITASWLILKRAPRWIRVVVSLWFIFFVLMRCDSESAKPEKTEKPKASETKLAAPAADLFKKTGSELEAFSEKADVPEGAAAFVKLGAEFARKLATQIETGALSGKALLIVPFQAGLTDPAQTELVNKVFSSLYARVAAARADAVGLVTLSLPSTQDPALVDVGRKFSAQHILGARLDTREGAPVLVVSLLKTSDAAVLWTKTYPLTGGDASVIGAEIADAVLAAVPAS